MPAQSTSITSAIEERTKGQRLFVSVREGWKAFLFYLQDRNGADIHDGKRMELIASALGFAESGGLEKQPNEVDSVALEKFKKFEQREDVRRAFEQFIEPRIAGLHMGAIQTSDDFDAPLPDEFWTGSP